MSQKSGRVRGKDKGKGTVVLKASFCGGDDTGRNNQDSDSEAESLIMMTMRMIVDDCVRIV